MKAWTSTEIDFLRQHLGLSTKEIFETFGDSFGSGRSYDSIQKKVKKLRDAYSDDPEEDTTEDEISDKIAQLIDPTPAGFLPFIGGAVPEREKRERREEARDWLAGIIDYTEEIREELENKQAAQAVLSDKTSLCVLISDVHVGKHTKWYNLETADERLQSIPGRISDTALPEIDEVVIILAGDIVEGEDIYPTQNNHIECSAIDQIIACAESLWKMVLRFREMFKCKVRIETCPGNHGRVSKSANEKTNWDNIVYHTLNVMITMLDDAEITMNCNYESFRTFQVKDKIGMAYHHGVKHTGTPAMREKVAGWIANKNFDFMVHGHWHEWHVGSWLGKFVVANGCVCGPDDLAERMGKEDDARQGYFFVTPGQPVWGFSFVEWLTPQDA